MKKKKKPSPSYPPTDPASPLPHPEGPSLPSPTADRPPPSPSPAPGGRTPWRFSLKQRRALWDSAEHWLENWELATKGKAEYAKIQGHFCACCAAFYDPLYCFDCPVTIETGESGCRKGPWPACRAAFFDCRATSPSDPHRQESDARAVEAYGGMYAFLVELALDRTPARQKGFTQS